MQEQPGRQGTTSTNASETRTARRAVVRMIADMICGPIIMVTASGSI
ncbi:hypothetical protein ACFQ07_11580 [Actinomadura adrarensis]|uniref:RDD family protein n=1 Tax=Actinomadura adrarensis TaxID=1819600 RepID=A0ABW3CH50_9ACTN